MYAYQKENQNKQASEIYSAIIVAVRRIRFRLFYNI